MGSKYLQVFLKVQGMGAWGKKHNKSGEDEENDEDNKALSFYLSFPHTRMSYCLSVSYIDLPVNPADLNDPSTAAPALRDRGKDKDARYRRKGKMSERL